MPLEASLCSPARPQGLGWASGSRLRVLCEAHELHPTGLGKALGEAFGSQGVEPDPTQGVQAAFWTEGHSHLTQEMALPRDSPQAFGKNVHRQC